MRRKRGHKVCILRDTLARRGAVGVFLAVEFHLQPARGDQRAAAQLRALDPLVSTSMRFLPGPPGQRVP